MYIVVVGAGKLGYYLTKDLLKKGHEVTLVDWNHGRVELLERELGGSVLYANGSSIDGLEKAGCHRADIIAATTGDDEDNLVICQLGKRYFHVPKAVARINNPKNEHVFRELGVGSTVSGTSAIADVIEAYMLKMKYKTLLTFDQGDMELIELDITAESPSGGRLISELELPEKCLIAIILRGRETIFAKGGTRLQTGDIVLAITNSEEKDKVTAVIQGLGVE